MLKVLSRDFAWRMFGPVSRDVTLEVIMKDRDQTGLMHAAQRCWPDICSELIDRGADVMAAFNDNFMISLYDPPMKSCK